MDSYFRERMIRHNEEEWLQIERRVKLLYESEVQCTQGERQSESERDRLKQIQREKQRDSVRQSGTETEKEEIKNGGKERLMDGGRVRHEETDGRKTERDGSNEGARDREGDTMQVKVRSSIC